MVRNATFVGTVMIAALAFAGCSGGDEAQTQGDAAEVGTAETTFKDSFDDPAAPAPAELDPNAASAADMAKEMEKLEVSDAEKWAGIVEANRPYDESDVFYKDLRAALEKEGADADLQDRIVSVLKPIE